MPNTDNKFQGFRPSAFGDVWDKMTSQERRRAFYFDLVVGIGGAWLLYEIARWLVHD